MVNIDTSITVSADSNAEQLARDWSELGLTEILEQQVDEVVQLGASALKSKVPIDTGELRNDNIEMVRTGSMKATVYISPVIHRSSKGATPPTANVLAMLLNLKKYKRSRQSQAENGFGSEGGTTDGWIEAALLEFDRRL